MPQGTTELIGARRTASLEIVFVIVIDVVFSHVQILVLGFWMLVTTELRYRSRSAAEA